MAFYKSSQETVTKVTFSPLNIQQKEMEVPATSCISKAHMDERSARSASPCLKSLSTAFPIIPKWCLPQNNFVRSIFS